MLEPPRPGGLEELCRGVDGSLGESEERERVLEFPQDAEVVRGRCVENGVAKTENEMNMQKKRLGLQ